MGRAYKMLMRLNIRCHLPFFFSICTDQYLVNTYGVTEDLHFNFVVSVCTLAPCILKCRKDCRSCVCIFTNLEAQERYLSIIRGAPQSTLITGNVCSRLLLLLRNRLHHIHSIYRPIHVHSECFARKNSVAYAQYA